MRKPKIELSEEILSLEQREDQSMIKMERTYELITPLYGGGVKSGEVNTETPIRGGTIRGQLRFWWRAICGGRYSEIADLKAREDAIWGSASSGSKVKIAIPFQSKGRPFQATNRDGKTVPIGDPRATLGYVAFPLREAGSDVYEDISFKLSLTFPEPLSADVTAALWAWETFGGVGARTRRGFGALTCTQVIINEVEQTQTAVTSDNLARWISDQLLLHQQGTDFHEAIPRIPLDLSQRLKVVSSPSFQSGISAWQQLVEKLQEFRHKRPINRVPQNGKTVTKPGRNRWPEPDAIRTKVEQQNRNYARKYPPLYDPEILKFPRADFGLPIIFELRGENGVPKVTLKGREHERMGSPLILRPYACANNQFVGLALVMDGPRQPPSGLILDGINNDTVFVQLEAEEAQRIAERDNNNYDGNVDILQSFLDSL